MFRRLIFPLAVRSLVASVLIASALCIFVAPVRLLHGDQGTAATLREFSAGASWSGYAITNAESFDPATCTKAQTCDFFTLKVDVSDQYKRLHPDFALRIRLSWDDPQNDFDLYVSKDGRILADSAQTPTNFEEVRVPHPADGTYQIFAHTAAADSGTPYSVQARIVSGSTNSPRQAHYSKDPDGKYGPEMFQFAAEPRRDGIPQGKRSSIVIDAFGDTYVAADGSVLAVGQPQFAAGRLYASESLGWAAASGPATLYTTALENEQLILRRSDNAGRTYDHKTLIARMPDQVSGISQGNLVTSSSGTVYNVFTGASGNDIYFAKCDVSCERFIVRRIFSGESDASLNHPYPMLALDHAGGLHVVFSDGAATFLMSSADGGTVWKDPVQINNPADAETIIAGSPSIGAGDSGRVGIVWLGPGGETYYAFTAEAFAPAPAIEYVSIGDIQLNANLPCLAADASGAANIVTGAAAFLRQIGGEKLTFDPLMTTAGLLKTETGTKRVSFTVHRDLSGTVAYLDEQRRMSLRSSRLISVRRTDQAIEISGRGNIQDGSEVTFTLVAGYPNAKDRNVSIAMSDGYFAAGSIQEASSTELKDQRARKH